MMKLLVKRFLFCFVILTALFATLIFRTPLHTQTNLMSLINNNTTQEKWPINKISDKFSSIINIVIESNDEKSAIKTANNIIKSFKEFAEKGFSYCIF
mgnify:CR=1 FL=1